MRFVIDPYGAAFRSAGATLLLISSFGCADLSTRGTDDIDTWPRLGLTEELRVGSVEDEDLGFSNISGIEVDHEGLVYVLERTAREIRVFSPDGERLRVIGGPGDGPGEFQLTLGGRMGFVGDTLWVSDARPGRITFFERTGALLGTTTIRPVLLGGPPGYTLTLLAGAFRQDGSITSSAGAGTPNARGRPTDVTLDAPTVRFDSMGAIVDSIRIKPLFIVRGSTRIMVDGRELIVPLPPRDEPLWMETADASEVFVIERPVAAAAGEAVMTVTKISGMADTLFRRELRYSPEPVAPAFLDSLIAPAVASHVEAVRGERPGVDSARVAAGASSTLKAEYDMPPFAPPVSSARVAQDGALWLRREDRGEPVFRWLVMDSDGDAIGQVDLPRTLTVWWSSGDVLWASQTDDLGVPWLVRYRVRPQR
jgi:hypothetical protein